MEEEVEVYSEVLGDELLVAHQDFLMLVSTLCFYKNYATYSKRG